MPRHTVAVEALGERIPRVEFPLLQSVYVQCSVVQCSAVPHSDAAPEYQSVER
jgi:hypothetical protein